MDSGGHIAAEDASQIIIKIIYKNKRIGANFDMGLIYLQERFKKKKKKEEFNLLK